MYMNQFMMGPDEQVIFGQPQITNHWLFIDFRDHRLFSGTAAYSGDRWPIPGGSLAYSWGVTGGHWPIPGGSLAYSWGSLAYFGGSLAYFWGVTGLFLGGHWPIPEDCWPIPGDFWGITGLFPGSVSGITGLLFHFVCWCVL